MRSPLVEIVGSHNAGLISYHLRILFFGDVLLIEFLRLNPSLLI